MRKTPILWINDDILVYVFTMIVPSGARDHCSKGKNNYDDQVALRTLLLICRRFNVLIHRTPYLWTYITSRMSSSIVRRRIELSKAAPLTIYFDTPRRISQTYREIFFGKIGHTIARWHVINIANLDQWDHFFSSKPCFATLKELDVASVDVDTPMLWNCSFPQLERLIYRSFNFLPTHTTFPSLRSCDITTFLSSLRPLRDFLSSISFIKDLRVVLSSTTDVVFTEELQNLGRLYLPLLEILTLVDGRGESYRLLSLMDLPKARKLFLSNVAGARTRSYLEDMAKGGCTYLIENLEFGARCSRGQKIGPILALFPCIRTLDLNVGGDLGAFQPDWCEINKERCPELRLIRIKHRLGEADKLKLAVSLQNVHLDGIDLEFDGSSY